MKKISAFNCFGIVIILMSLFWIITSLYMMCIWEKQQLDLIYSKHYTTQELQFYPPHINGLSDDIKDKVRWAVPKNLPKHWEYFNTNKETALAVQIYKNGDWQLYRSNTSCTTFIVILQCLQETQE